MQDATGQNYFALFQFPTAFALDAAELRARYLALQQQYHPDRFAAASDYEKRLAVSMSATVNDAYAVLKKPLSRMVYLLKLHGHDALAETNTSVPEDFLEQQMQWREALMDAGDDATALAALADEIAQARGAVVQQACDHADVQAYEAAVASVRQWVYLEKLADNIAAARRQLTPA